MFWKLPYSDDETRKGCEPVDEVVGHVEELKLVGSWGKGGAHDQVHLHLKPGDLIFWNFPLTDRLLTVGSIVPREFSWERNCLKAASLSFRAFIFNKFKWSHLTYQWCCTGSPSWLEVSHRFAWSRRVAIRKTSQSLAAPRPCCDEAPQGARGTRWRRPSENFVIPLLTSKPSRASLLPVNVQIAQSIIITHPHENGHGHRF